MSTSLASQDGNALASPGGGAKPSAPPAEGGEAKEHPQPPPPSLSAAIKYKIKQIPYVGKYVTKVRTLTPRCATVRREICPFQRHGTTATSVTSPELAASP